MLYVVMFIIALGMACDFASAQGTWTQINGTAREVSARGKELWAITKYNQVMRMVNGEWVHSHYLGHEIAASPDGYSWMIAEWQYANIYRYNLPSGGISWTEPRRGGASRISAMDASTLVVAGTEGCAWKSVGGGAWFRPDVGPCDGNYDLAIGDYGETWKLDFDRKVYRLNAAAVWEKIAVPFVGARSIDVQSATRVAVVDQAFKVYMFNGTGWTGFPIQPKCAQVSINYTSVFCADFDNKIWKNDII